MSGDLAPRRRCATCRHFGAEPLDAFPDHIVPYVLPGSEPSDYRLCLQDGEVTELVGDFTICTAEGSCDGWEPRA